jgi:hypothetical protein
MTLLRLLQLARVPWRRSTKCIAHLPDFEKFGRRSDIPFMCHGFLFLSTPHLHDGRSFIGVLEWWNFTLHE